MEVELGKSKSDCRIDKLEQRVTLLEEKVAAGTTTTINNIANDLKEAIEKNLKSY